MSFLCVEYGTSTGRKDMATIPSAWFNSVLNEFSYPKGPSSTIKNLFYSHALPKENWPRFPEARILFRGREIAFLFFYFPIICCTLYLFVV